MKKDKKIYRREFLKAGAGVAAGMLLQSVSWAEKKTRTGPNFLFIVADDLGYTGLNCYGSKLHETPNIDKFTGSALRFTQAYAAAPVCTPTRASIMTGKYPARLNMTIWSEAAAAGPKPIFKLIDPVTESNLPLDEITIAEALDNAGYLTAHIGKWHLGNAKHYPETQGFDVNVGGTLWGAPPTYFYPYRGSEKFDELRYVPDLPFGDKNEYLTDRLTNEAIKVMDKAGDRPFFLHLSYHTVHSPIQAKPETTKYYREKIKPQMKHKNPEYAAMIHSLDQNVGRLLAKLEHLGIADNTVVIFYSDNGAYVGEINGRVTTSNHPLRSGKGSLYEGGIRVPLIIRWPGVTKPASVCHQPVSSIDFFPTIIQIAGIEADQRRSSSIDGVNIAPLIENPKKETDREALFWHYPHYYSTTTPVSAVRSGKWKLLEFFEDGRLELYNIEKDIGEKNNLAKTNPDITDKLKKRLHRWRQDVKAKIPKPNPDFVPDTEKKAD